jgi:hypothetical protein
MKIVLPASIEITDALLEKVAGRARNDEVSSNLCAALHQ